MKCELCGRENQTTFHHLIPRCLHKSKWYKKRYTREELNSGINICKYECHRQIHTLYSEKELGRTLYTLDLLQQDEKVQNYIKFVNKRSK